MTKTYDVVDGVPVVDLTGLVREELLERKRAVEARLGAINRSGAWFSGSNRSQVHVERQRLKAANEAIDRRLTELREQQKKENTRRAMAGLGSPLWEACGAAFAPDVLGELEKDALARFDARAAKKKLDQKNA